MNTTGFLLFVFGMPIILGAISGILWHKKYGRIVIVEGPYDPNAEMKKALRQATTDAAIAGGLAGAAAAHHYNKRNKNR